MKYVEGLSSEEIGRVLDCSAAAVDSLLNYETVKYFGNEEFEAGRYDKALQSYERAAVATASSLSMLNVGQGVIIAVGVTWVMRGRDDATATWC